MCNNVRKKYILSVRYKFVTIFSKGIGVNEQSAIDKEKKSNIYFELKKNSLYVKSNLLMY